MKKIENPWLHYEGYNCFGCCPTNSKGLQMEFFEQGDEVVSVWRPSPDYQGWIDTLHGGIQAALLDEIAAWAVMHFARLNGVTAKMEVRYHKPVMTTDDHLTLRAKITLQRGPLIGVTASLSDASDVECTTAEFTYFADKTKPFI